MRRLWGQSSHISTRKAKCALIFLGKSETRLRLRYLSAILLRRVAFPDFCEPWPPARQATYLDFIRSRR